MQQCSYDNSPQATGLTVQQCLNKSRTDVNTCWQVLDEREVACIWLNAAKIQRNNRILANTCRHAIDERKVACMRMACYIRQRTNAKTTYGGASDLGLSAKRSWPLVHLTPSSLASFWLQLSLQTSSPYEQNIF